jgi:hypothetical protein
MYVISYLESKTIYIYAMHKAEAYFSLSVGHNSICKASKETASSYNIGMAKGTAMESTR